MFSYQGDRGPPAVVTTPGKIRNQYNESDWAPPRPSQQQYREARESYWSGNRGGGGGGGGSNSILADNEQRDIRIPSSNYQYGSLLSPPTHLHAYQPLQQKQKLSRSEMASYMSAVKAVNESINSDGQRGSVKSLRGLWKVFDAAVNELGTELNDSLSNKAIFEGKRYIMVV